MQVADDIRIAIATKCGMMDKDGGVSPLDAIVIERAVGVLLGEPDSIEFMRNVISYWDNSAMIGKEPVEGEKLINNEDFTHDENWDCKEQTYTATEHHMALEKAYQSGIEEGKLSVTKQIVVNHVENFHG